jgi:4-hydroxy-tetrahydrodipicolinate synthase
MKPFSGVTTALVTPFRSGRLDEGSFLKLIKTQLQGGVQGFVINGTTAESPNMTPEEVQVLFQWAKKNTPEKFPLIVGTGSNSTAQTVENSKRAEKMGADAALVVVPYYNKPPQAGLFEHFRTVADAINIPLILYNVPSRTVTSLEVETIHKLSAHPQIVGIKEASGNISLARQIRKSCGDQFLLLTGDDATYEEFMDAGGDGVISVASHIIPEAFLKRQTKLFQDLIQLLFCESNPMPVKAALAAMKIIQSDELRLPMVPMSAGGKEKLLSEMKSRGLL